MKYYFTRGTKNNGFQTYSCSLHVSNHYFTIWFDKPLEEVGLNDGNFHSVNQLKGKFFNLTIDNVGISLDGCFILIGDKWHSDGMTLFFRPPV